MATIIAAGGSLTAVANTAIESTGQARYLRATFYNTGTGARTVSIRIGTQTMETIYILPGKKGYFATESVGAGETFQAWQDAGTDVNYRVSGEY